ncbi:MAG TPA: LCP family protein, partial [Methylomirabilota bacterium]|nr:LCP family protein [Methylomirabilota bacterium]
DQEITDLSAQLASGSATEVDSFPCRYEHLHFDKGPTHMDGTTALKYVRSRHAEGIEGSDFARSKRQEKVISAFKEKLFSAGTLLNPVKIADLVKVLQDSIETDIKSDEYDDFVRLAQEFKGVPIKSTVLDTGQGDRLGLLINPPISPEFNNAWVLSPRAGNGKYNEIQKYVRCFIAGSTCIVTETGIITPTPTPTLTVPKSAKKN